MFSWFHWAKREREKIHTDLDMLGSENGVKMEEEDWRKEYPCIGGKGVTGRGYNDMRDIDGKYCIFMRLMVLFKTFNKINCFIFQFFNRFCGMKSIPVSTILRTFFVRSC